MYLLFRYHHIMPGEYEKMGFGERTVVRNIHALPDRTDERGGRTDKGERKWQK